MAPGAKVQGRQNGAYKNFTIRVKNRSQARSQQRHTSSDTPAIQTDAAASQYMISP